MKEDDNFIEALEHFATHYNRISRMQSLALDITSLALALLTQNYEHYSAYSDEDLFKIALDQIKKKK